MSKSFRSFLLIFAVSVQILYLFSNSFGQEIEVAIRIGVKTPNVVTINGRFLREQPSGTELSIQLMTGYAGVDDLEKRVSDVHLFDGKGADLPLLPMGGNYFAERRINSWSYSVDLTPISNTTAAGHLSWMQPDGGILMVDDLLPQEQPPSFPGLNKRVALIKLDIPSGWKIFTTASLSADKTFNVQDIEKAAFVIGRSWREKSVTVEGCSVSLLLSGEWSFTDDEAAAVASEIFAHYLKLFGSAPGKTFQIALYKFPFQVPFGEWEADTRGSSVTIASSDMPFKSQSLQRLHEQLRHEIFHLWVPNGLDLWGDYDWFYEGFALYQSLRLGVAVNRIRFEDMLDTLLRAYNIDKASGQRMSLIVASGNRWKGANTQIYARGMLVAFLCDLALLDASKGKFSTNDLLRRFYADFSGPNLGVDGNAAIIGSFYRHKELRPMVDRYISGSEAIDWEALLGTAGLEAISKGNVTNLAVKKKLSGRQKDLLDKLGYNNWRKLSKSLK